MRFPPFSTPESRPCLARRFILAARKRIDGASRMRGAPFLFLEESGFSGLAGSPQHVESSIASTQEVSLTDSGGREPVATADGRQGFRVSAESRFSCQESQK